MNNARDTIMETLAQAGITNLTVDDVIAEFQASDELAGYLAGADDTEQVILAHLPEYLALRGFAAEVGAAAEEADPPLPRARPAFLPCPPPSPLPRPAPSRRS